MEDEEIPPSPDIEISFRTRRKRLSKRHLSFVSSSTQANSESLISDNCNETLYDRIYGEADEMNTEELFRSQDIFPAPGKLNTIHKINIKKIIISFNLILDEFVSDHSNDISQTLVINETSDSANETSEDDVERSTLRNEQLNDKLKNFLDKQISSRQHFYRQNILKGSSCSSKDNPTSRIVNKIDSKEATIDIMAPFIELEMCSLTKQKSVRITPKFSQLCQSKDFMTAEVYHEKETNVLHHSFLDNKSTHQVTQPKVVYSMADAVLEDFDNFDDPMVVIDNSNEEELKDYRSSDDDDEELNQSIFMTSSAETQPNQVEFLNSSLEALSQKLRSFSQHHLGISPANSVSDLHSVASNLENDVDEVDPVKEMEKILPESYKPLGTLEETLPDCKLKSSIPVKKKSMRIPRLSTNKIELENQPNIKKQKTEKESSESCAITDNSASTEKNQWDGAINSNISKELQPEPKFSGFSMASGRKLKFNEEDLKKIASNFAKEDEKFEKEPNLEIIKNSSCPLKLPQKIEPPKSFISYIQESPISTASTSKFSGFSMASGRTLKFNDDVLKKIASNFEIEDEKFEQKSELKINKESIRPIIALKSSAAENPQKLETPKSINNYTDESPVFAASTSKFSGFSMASGRSLKFNEDQLKKIASSFAKDDEKFEKDPSLDENNFPSRSSLSTKLPQKLEPKVHNIQESPLSTASTSKFSGFSMASGRTLKFNEEKLKKIALNFEKEDEEFEKEPLIELVKNSSRSAKLPQKFDSPKPYIEESPLFTASTSKFSGFSMASGRTLKFNDEVLKKIESNFAADDEKFDNESGFEMLKNSCNSSKLSKAMYTPKLIEESPLSTASTSKFSGFAMASGRNLKFNEKQLKKIASNFAKEDEKFEFSDVNVPEAPKPKPTVVNPSSSGLRLKNPPKDVIISSTPIRVRDISKKRKFELDDFSLMCSPVLKSIPRIVKPEDIKTPAVNKLKSKLECIQTPTESQEVKSVLEMCMDLDDSIDSIQQSPKKRRFAKTKLFSQFNQSAELNSSWNDVDMELLKTVEMDNNILESVRKARRIAIETQLESIVHKEEALCTPVVGKMFQTKQDGNRMKISTYVEHQKPKQLRRHQVTFETALDYHFNMQNYLR